MSHPYMHANVIEPSGEYYQVKLFCIPNVGDSIDLTSLKNIETGNRDKIATSYTVKRVAHKLHDITEAAPNGAHEVEIYV